MAVQDVERLQEQEQAQKEVSAEMVLELLRWLPPRERLRVIARVLPEVDREIPLVPVIPKKSLLGALRDLGTAPSAEEIDEARREMWGNFHFTINQAHPPCITPAGR